VAEGKERVKQHVDSYSQFKIQYFNLDERSRSPLQI